MWTAAAPSSSAPTIVADDVQLPKGVYGLPSVSQPLAGGVALLTASPCRVDGAAAQRVAAADQAKLMRASQVCSD